MDRNSVLIIVAGFYPDPGEEIPDGYEEYEFNNRAVHGRIAKRITADEILESLSIEKVGRIPGLVEAKALFEMPTVKTGEFLFKVIETTVVTPDLLE